MGDNLKSRNFKLLRSLLFGVFAKLVGGLTVFLGLPLISHSLSAKDYARFLQAMSAGTIVTLFFGAACMVAVRSMTSSADQSASNENTSRSFSLFPLLAGGALAVGLIFWSISPSDPLIGSAYLAAIGIGLLSWGDAFRVATRTDHISSLWQMVGTTIMLGLMFLLRDAGVYPLSLLYFGMPLVIQLGIFAQLYIGGVRPELKFSMSIIRSSTKPLLSNIINSCIEYIKIFGSGLLVLSISGELEYARHVTIVLLVARLVNPISLLTRPLMPAYIDAMRTEDRNWLKSLLLVSIFGAIISLITCCVIGAIAPFELVTWALPKSLEHVTRPEMVFILLFFWGHAFTSLTSPLLFALSKEMTFTLINGTFVALGIAYGVFAPRIIACSPMILGLSVATACCAAALLLLNSAIIARRFFGSVA